MESAQVPIGHTLDTKMPALTSVAVLGRLSDLHVSGVLWCFHGVIGTVLRTLYSYIRGADEDQRGSHLYTRK